MFTSSGRFLTKFGESGSGDGQLRGPEGVGVDMESSAVYIADTGNNRIQRFEHQ
jgi:DNA-binding beta-propeller fold protein YncE